MEPVVANVHPVYKRLLAGQKSGGAIKIMELGQTRNERAHECAFIRSFVRSSLAPGSGHTFAVSSGKRIRLFTRPPPRWKTFYIRILEQRFNPEEEQRFFCNRVRPCVTKCIISIIFDRTWLALISCQLIYHRSEKLIREWARIVASILAHSTATSFSLASHRVRSHLDNLLSTPASLE